MHVNNIKIVFSCFPCPPSLHLVQHKELDNIAKLSSQTIQKAKMLHRSRPNGNIRHACAYVLASSTPLLQGSVWALSNHVYLLNGNTKILSPCLAPLYLHRKHTVHIWEMYSIVTLCICISRELHIAETSINLQYYTSTYYARIPPHPHDF